MATLRPFRQIHENDVVNLFALHDADIGAYSLKGAIVKLDTAHPWVANDELGLESISSYTNTASHRWVVNAHVTLAVGLDAAFGMMLHDVKSVDENGEDLRWHPGKAHEMNVSLKGQSVPVLTKGIVLVNGVDATEKAIAVGVKVYSAANGGIRTLTDAHEADATYKVSYLGFCMSAVDNGNVLIKFEPRSL